MKTGNSTRTGITAGGTWMIDYTKTISQFPEEGSCSTIYSETVNNGGAPYNLLVNLCRLGAPFPLRAVGCLGHDLDGDSIMKDCIAHGIDPVGMRTIPWASTSFSDVMTVKETGVRTSFNHPGANDVLAPEHFDFDQDPSRIFFLGSLFFFAELDKPHEKYGTVAASVLARARQKGILTCVDIERTSLSPQVFAGNARAALKQTDLIILNVEVAEVLTGIRLRFPSGIDVHAVEDAAKHLRELASAQCVVLRYPTGALAITASGQRAAEGSVNLPKSRIVSAAGAGHAFTAGFLFGYHESWPLSECLKGGHAAAAACLEDQTTSGGLRKMSSCMARLEKYGQR